MKKTEVLINDLRNEYLSLTREIAKAEFADATLSFDDTEHKNLQEQIEHMKNYAEVVKRRANYARTKSNQKEDEPLMEPVPVPVAFNQFDFKL